MLVHADANAFNKLLENKGTFVVDSSLHGVALVKCWVLYLKK